MIAKGDRADRCWARERERRCFSREAEAGAARRIEQGGRAGTERMIGAPAEWFVARRAGQRRRTVPFSDLSSAAAIGSDYRRRTLR